MAATWQSRSRLKLAREMAVVLNVATPVTVATYWRRRWYRFGDIYDEVAKIATTGVGNSRSSAALLAADSPLLLVQSQISVRGLRRALAPSATVRAADGPEGQGRAARAQVYGTRLLRTRDAGGLRGQDRGVEACRHKPSSRPPIL